MDNLFRFFRPFTDMTVFLSLSFWLSFIAFLFATFFSFYIPGSVLLHRLRLSPFQHSVLSLLVGMSFWGWQGFVFGFLGIRWMTYIYLFVFLVLWLTGTESKKFFHCFKKWPQIRARSLDILLVFLVTIGTLLQICTIFFNGMPRNGGLSFCCGLPDSLYHIALTNQLITQFPPTEPGMAGIIVHNYHYLSNVVSADLIRVFHLPLIATQFQYLAILLSLLIGLSAIVFGQLLHMKKSYIRWLVFFLYFSGDMTYLLAFFAGKGFDYNTPYLENALWLWFSPPRVFALVVFFAGLSLLTIWVKQKQLYTGMLVAFVFASLISFKIYAGIFMASGVAALFFYYALQKKIRMLIPLVATVLLSLIFYLPVNAQAGGLVFVGTWRFEDFIAQHSLGLYHLEMAREVYVAHHNWFGDARFEAVFILLYLFFVFGTIFFGVFQTRKSLSYFPREVNLFLIAGFAVSALLGFFFLQQSGGANSSQFLITIDILGSLYAALACFYWLDKRNRLLQYVVIFFIVLLTVPRVFNTAYTDIMTLLYQPIFTVDSSQLQALAYIKQHSPTSAIILVDNLSPVQQFLYDAKKKKLLAIPIHDTRTWKGNNAYYISFLANRSLFIDGDIAMNSIVASHGVDTSSRVNDATIILMDKKSSVVKFLLLKNNISYIYLGSNTPLAKKPYPSFVKPVFRNKEITVLQVL